MLVHGALLILGILLLVSGVFAIVRLWQSSATLFRSSQVNREGASVSRTGSDSEQNRFLLFGVGFIVALFLAAVSHGLSAGWQSGMFSFVDFRNRIVSLIMFAPISIPFFPAGLTAYLPASTVWKSFLVLFL